MATYRLPFENVPGWTVGKGNFDDPGAHHDIGQAFAWDFNFPIPDGAKILAARAGTVIDSRANATKVLPPKVNDQLWGPGNYVVIRHADETIGAYDHMHPNTVRVQAGQYVDQGAWIGNVGKTGSTSGGVVHLHFECHTWLTVGSTGPGTVVNNKAGPSLLVHLEDVNHHSFRPVVGTSLHPFPATSRQDGWRWCVKCGGMYLSYWGLANACIAGGSHAFNESGNYVLPNNASNAPGQPGWRYCHKCAGMFFSLHPGSKCPITNPSNSHDATGSGDYSLLNNAANAPGQHHWRWCHKCQGLWFEDGQISVCPSDKGAHSLAESGDYAVEVNPQDIQKNWQKCARCQTLYLASNGIGVCKTGPGGHNAGGTSSYLLVDDVSPVNSNGPKQAGWEGGWRYCKKCGALWMGQSTGSYCPTGGGHSLIGSGEYWLRIYTSLNSAPGEPGWKLCDKCQSLWSGDSHSVCPMDGIVHSTASSTEYALIVDYA